MSDMLPTTATPIPSDQATPDGAPFVRTYIDKDTGRAIIALDGAAVDDLLQLIQDLGPGYDLTQNPGTYGVDQATADRLADTAGRITGPLAKLKGYL